MRIDTLNVILYYNLQRLVGNSGRWKKNLASLKDIYNRSFIGHQFRSHKFYTRSHKFSSGFVAGTLKVILIMIVIISEGHPDYITYVS